MSFDPLPDSVLDGDAVSRFFEILRESDPKIAEEEITALIDRAQRLEAFVEERGLLKEASIHEIDQQAERQNYCIGAMARIVSQHER